MLITISHKIFKIYCRLKAENRKVGERIVRIMLNRDKRAIVIVKVMIVRPLHENCGLGGDHSDIIYEHPPPLLVISSWERHTLYTMLEKPV